MTSTERKGLIRIAAQALSNAEFAATVSAAEWRRIWLAIDEEMGREPDPGIMVDDLLYHLGVRWIPET